MPQTKYNPEYFEFGIILVNNQKRNRALFRAREKLGLNAKTAAIAIGIPYSLYYRYENLTSYPNTENQEKVCIYFRSQGIPLDEKYVFPLSLAKAGDYKPNERKLEEIDLVYSPNIENKGVFVPGPEKEFERGEEKTNLNILLMKALSTLPSRQNLILYLYYTEKWSLEKIGSDIRVSKERVRQLKKKALGRLRNDYPQLEGLLYI